ncbi:MAG: T9SS type A sorting domain-containing protein [Ignavibacteriales bacterium]|nr:T9SS type A sorting domain-containing protein [Ignavibacteriales bacterium]
MSVETVGSSVPVEFNLSQNYPNPFNPSTVIRFAIPAENLVTLNIYSITGELVASLLNEVKTAGEYEVSFDATSLPTGVYIYKINAGSFSSVKKMMLVK